MNFKVIPLIISLSIILGQLSFAQMTDGGVTRYGNEWIDYSQEYFKIRLNEDGIYRVTYSDLNNAGVFSSSSIPTGSDFKMYRLGQEVPIFASTTGTFSSSDYIEFYGEKNRGEVDKYLYEFPEYQLNDKVSMFMDGAVYFLTWNTDTGSSLSNIPNGSSAGLSPEPYCMFKKEIVYKERVDYGYYNGGSSDWRCPYDLGEGVGKNTYSENQEFELYTGFLYGAGTGAKLTTRFLSKTRNHDISIKLNGNTVLTDTYSGWSVRQYDIDLDAADMLSDGVSNFVKIEGLHTIVDVDGNIRNVDKFRMAHIGLVYPRILNFGNQTYVEFGLPEEIGDRYLEINNFDFGGQAPILYDITNNLRIETTLNGSTIEVVLPAASGERKIALVSVSGFKSPLEITKRDFVEYDFSTGAYDYIMVGHPVFFDDGMGNNYMQEYADYRSTAQGGDYTPLAVDVTQLYDQFGYGVDRHEQAIKNFLKKASITWNPKLAVFIGKGVIYEKMRFNALSWRQFSLVPSYGYPSSDHLFVTDHGGTDPWMGVGRIAAKNPAQLKLYLDKVKEYEMVQGITPQTINDKAWMKKVLHFGGGDEGIQNTIKQGLNLLKDSLETSLFGADVTSFFKRSTGTVTNVPFEEVQPLINNGAALMTFFGHSAPSTLDFDLGNPNEYENSGKYPIFYAIGCSTNRIFETETSLSEEFVFIEDKGCIGFLGATWVTNLSNLSQYATYIYENIGNDNYGEPIGEIIKETIIDYNFSDSYTAELLRNAMIFQGDPALKIYPHQAPDYIVDKARSNIEPNIINADSDSFDLELVLANIGSNIQDSFNVKLEQELPNGTIVDLGVYRISTFPFEKILNYTLPLTELEALGLNEIIVTLDIDDEVLEAPGLAEANNVGRIPFFIIANDVLPITPSEFSIVSENPLTLIASSTNVFASNLNYVFEIDTTELFDSPIKETQIISQIAGVVECQPNISLSDNIVYYWRVSIDSTQLSSGEYNWHNSSFIFLDGNEPGWNQSHFYQYDKDSYEGVVCENDVDYFDFSVQNYQFRVMNGALGSSVTPEDIATFRDGFRIYNYYNCSPSMGDRTVWAQVFDPVNLWFTDEEPTTPNFLCFGDAPNMVFAETITTTAQRARLMDFLDNHVPDGHYVIFNTTQRVGNNYNPNGWLQDSVTLGRNVMQVLEEQGAELIRETTTGPNPYIFVYKKNDPSFQPREVLAGNINEEVEVNVSLAGKAKQGKVTSTKIGPASSWDNMLWQVSDYDNTKEGIDMDIYGIGHDGVSTLLMDSVTVYNQSLTSFDANEYPYLQLVYNSQDSIDNTPPQLDYWRVHYTPIPEAALAPNRQFVFEADTLQEGQPFHLEIGVENISEVDMDSMLMKYTIIDANNNQLVESRRLKPLLVDEVLVAEFDYPTNGLVGDNQIIIEANPDEDQLELYHFNNIGARNFHVLGDTRNPLMDVTFDGIHIMDGDLISAEPEIMVSLEDENKYIALSDSSIFRVFVTDPSDNVQEYYMDGSTLLFIPADDANLSEENRARLEFRPIFTENGIYQLQVISEDMSGNDSGDLDYRINFEVITEELVSNVLNYPNPFSTSTQFVFTLTGNELPDYMKIQIMTVSGKVVREITMDELGAIRIGNNISDYRWDGTDEYGDKLANGVYMYRVIVQKDGQNYDKYDTNTNQFFKRGFGKLMILR